MGHVLPNVARNYLCLFLERRSLIYAFIGEAVKINLSLNFEVQGINAQFFKYDYDRCIAPQYETPRAKP